jgi:peptide methionine sulfoxide reductase MsrB
MKFLVFRMGAVGGAFEGRLALSGQEVWFIARGTHPGHMFTHGPTTTEKWRWMNSVALASQPEPTKEHFHHSALVKDIVSKEGWIE